MGLLAESLDTRSPERLRLHYEVERELSDRLRAASAEERATLDGEVFTTSCSGAWRTTPQLVVKAGGERLASSWGG